MNPHLKQRLVGAVVLVALAVIFLPMLLDGSGARERLDEEIQIPEKPEPPASQLDEGDGEAVLLDTDDAGPDTGAGEPAPDADGATADSVAANPPADGASDTAQASADDTSSDAGSTGGQSNTDSGLNDNRLDEGWVVQVGSFQRETNALVLRDKLRQDGFDAHADRVNTDGRTLWRVRIGPVAERDAGEALLERVEAHRGSDALLMSYP